MERKPVKLKRYFLMLIAWVAIIVVIIGGSYVYKSYQGSKYEAAVPYVEQVVPLLAEWDEDKTRDLLAAETLATIPEGNIEKAMEIFSRLGVLQSMEEPQFEEAVELQSDGDAGPTLLMYSVPTRFTNGPAEFRIQMIDRGDHYQLYDFTLGSEILTGEAR